MQTQVLVEAIVVGIVLLVVWAAIYYVFQFAGASESYLLPLSIFVAGFASHLTFEAVGANKWYCNNGAACQ
jgi:hypothetical protein